MNIFEILNSQYVTQTQYDTILAQQKAYQKYINLVQQDKVSEAWSIVKEAGILDICYDHYKEYAKEQNKFDITPIQILQDTFIELEGEGIYFNYIDDFKKYIGIKQSNNLEQYYKQLAIEYELEDNLQDYTPIRLLKLYAEKIYSEEGFLNQLIEFGAKLESIESLPKHLIQQVHSDRTIKSIFEAVLYYPETNDHLLEFKESIQITKMYIDMDETLQNQMKKRLLISGVNTETILKFYVNLLRILQFVDQEHFIFESVTKPIKEYLLQRSDFLRCIIAILTHQNYQTDKILIYQNSDDSSEETTQERDLTSVLVSLYGSQEAFIQEYQNMVAEKILSPKEFSLEKEIANIELMKIRFGEQSMNTCSIMMKDIYESKRIHHNISINNFQTLNPLLISKTFWPISYDFKPTFTLPQDMEILFKEYQKNFEKAKTMRTLLWHHDLGSVTLELSFDNGDFEFKCLPIHAILIRYFNDIQNKELTSDYLSQQLQMSHEDLKRRMQFWVQKGVIKEKKNDEIMLYYSVNEYKPQQCDELLIEEIPEDLFVSSTTFLQSNQLIQQISHYLLELLKQTGPLIIQKIVSLFKTLLKGEFSQIITENNIKEAIKILIQKRKLQMNGEYVQLID